MLYNHTLKYIQIKTSFLVFVYTLIASFFTGLQAQTVQPFILNNGGQSKQNSDLKIEWSLAEAVSITTLSNENWHFSMGVLQPSGQLITNLSEITLSGFGKSIQIGPNPTLGPMDIITQLNQSGKLTFQILNSNSEKILQIETKGISALQVHPISLDPFPGGLYYLKVFFEPLSGKSKTGIYKIVKL
jgi:hypothetical protein